MNEILTSHLKQLNSWEELDATKLNIKPYLRNRSFCNSQLTYERSKTTSSLVASITRRTNEILTSHLKQLDS
jgi:hypothetical protein